MIGLAVGLFLIASLLLAHLWVRTEPLKRESPLDVDANLPSPWAGHASSIFSLTALFGAYLAVLVVLGPSALIGVALGGIASLIIIRNAIRRSGANSFEEFLKTRKFSVDPQNNEFSFFLLAATQIGFAISELVILRDLSVHAFSMAPRHATVFALSAALIAYLYSLAGGYGAVFRTDVLQFGFIALMCTAIAVVALPSLTADQVRSLTQPMDISYWSFGMSMPTAVRVLLNFVIGTLTGACFLAASPDTWKRVYLTSRLKNQSSFYALTIAGGLPFLLLVPAALLVPKVSLATISPFEIVHQASSSRLLLLVVTLGMISAFMSSFDSALITAIHIIMTRKEVRALARGDMAQFHYTAGLCFSAISVGALALISILGNSYFLAAYLLSLYAMVGGKVIGTGVLSQPARAGKIPWPSLAILVGWFIYMISIPGVLEKPRPEQIKAFGPGMLVFCLYAATSYARSRNKKPKGASR